MRLVVLTGASGSGKTTIARAVQQRHAGLATVLFFDSIGVPSIERMIAHHGSGEAWQKAATLRWMERIAGMSVHTRNVLFEGQARISFLEEGVASVGIEDFHIVLVDCDDATRAHRLSLRRGQSELANPTMMNWAEVLRAEAELAGCDILDTSTASLDTCVERVCSLFAR
jgi:ABC-type taurine transport system ATPase subunit